ncbi:MAG TPA: HNH endonuclease [Planctomycetaceae bacterium]|nr:HNH endonuclease [Planctomycetaceae bacterium]
MFESWNTLSKGLVDRLQSNPRSELCKHGAEIYPVNMNKGREVRVGWIRGSGGGNACMARIVAKANGSIDLYLHLDPAADLIGDGKPFTSAYHGNKTDLDMGKVNLSETHFPEAVFEWIACASRHSRKKHNIPISATEISATKTPVTPVALAKTTPKVDLEEEFREGQRKLRTHKNIERNTKAIKQKKALVLEETGALKCEACNFDFYETYGEIGQGFAECHHRTPIHTLKEESTLTLDQLAIVCSNCHRILHRPPFLTVERLGNLLDVRHSE